MCSQRFGGRFSPAQLEIRRRVTAHIGIPAGRDLLGRIADMRGQRLRSDRRGDRIACTETPRITRSGSRSPRRMRSWLRLGGVGISVERACQRHVEAVVYVLRLVTPGSESRGYGRPQHITEAAHRSATRRFHFCYAPTEQKCDEACAQPARASSFSTRSFAQPRFVLPRRTTKALIPLGGKSAHGAPP